MTSTAVKGVGNLLNNLTTNVAGQAAAKSQAGAVSFQSVWSSQAGKGGSQASQPDKAVSKKQAARAGESLQAKNAGRMKEAKADQPDVDAQMEENAQDDQMQNAMEVLGTAAMDLIMQITDTLGISAEELKSLLGQMDLEAVDLLDAENLNAFLLQAFGAEDSVALLTDADMYADYKLLMGELERMLQAESGPDGMTVADAYELVRQDPGAMEDMAGLLSSAKEEKPLESRIEVTEAEPEGEAAEQPLDAQTNVSKEAVQPDHTNERRSDSKNHSEHGGGQEGNPLLQSFSQINPNLVENAQAAEASGGFDVDTQDIMRQIMDYMKIQVKPGMSDLEMQLHPESLGTLQIHLAAKGGAVTASLIAQNEAVKAVLESQLVQLKENFAQQGVRVEAIEVTVQTHEFEQNLEQGRERGQEQTESRGQRTRRIRLDGALGAEELAELPEEDQLAAEMMAASGNTVDYTA